MPAVELGHAEEPVERPELEDEVRMLEESVDGGEEAEEGDQATIGADDDQRDQG